MKKLEIVLWLVLISSCILASAMENMKTPSLILMGLLPILHFIFARKWYVVNKEFLLPYATAWSLTLVCTLAVLEANNLSNEGYRLAFLISMLAWGIYVLYLRSKEEAPAKDRYNIFLFKMYLISGVPVLFF
ncbi:MAG: hypothetical protein SGI87_06205 [Flavobacteriales bacterium]|nr:hypothetical protein [Flavobacteriales bacterium]